jgi:hypothetical protein
MLGISAATKKPKNNPEHRIFLHAAEGTSARDGFSGFIMSNETCARVA